LKRTSESEVMPADIICPDCGGVIGADPTDLRRQCSCLDAKPESSAPEFSEPSSSGDTFVERTDAPKQKVCCQCGKDLNGQRRLRDSRGYWCYACHKLDKEANKPKGVACGSCGRIVPEAALADYEGSMLCAACRQERKEIARERRRLSPVSTTAHDEMNRSRLFWMLAFVALLVVVLLLRKFVSS
jgi:hypothetical protein